MTTVLGLLSDYSRVDRSIMERACEFGSAVHKIVELHETGRLDESSLRPKDQYLADMTPILDAWKLCKSETGLRVLHVEQVVVSIKYGYAGRLDAIAEVHGVPAIVEIKSRPFNGMLEPLQTAAYLEAWNENHRTEKAKARWFCELRLDGSYVFKKIKQGIGEPDHFTIFRSALAILRWRRMTNGK